MALTLLTQELGPDGKRSTAITATPAALNICSGPSSSVAGVGVGFAVAEKRGGTESNKAAKVLIFKESRPPLT